MTAAPSSPPGTTVPRARNDPAQYDDLAGEWWRPYGAFAMLHWIAAARSALVPPAARPGAVLVDIGCGGGLLAPHVAGKGYTHVGVDLRARALGLAREHGVTAVGGDALALPLATGVADVVVAGEVLEHVTDMSQCISEACRVLRGGGTLVLDTIAATWLARALAVTLAERLPGGPPAGLHDPGLFVRRDHLRQACARHGVRVQLSGLRPSLTSVVAWALRRRPAARMVPTWSTAVLFQGRGVKEGG
jgi:2-polyprenyl-6-hydroxyphenyl methylase / 3-demethylubiquinone-9 3-methyltransferase